MDEHLDATLRNGKDSWGLKHKVKMSGFTSGHMDTKIYPVLLFIK